MSLDKAISPHIPYIAAHRFRTIGAESGTVPVGAGATVTWSSFSGLGEVPFVIDHESTGIPPADAFNYIWIGIYRSYLDYRGAVDVSRANMFGFTATGWYQNRVFVKDWDTVNNVFNVFSIYGLKQAPFRSLLEVKFVNAATVGATMFSRFTHSFFVSSKRIIMKLPTFTNALDLRKKSGIRGLTGCPILVRRLGYFEIEEEHPYREFLRDLPNRYDSETVIAGYPPFRSASEAAQNFVAELYCPEEWSAERAIGRIKPAKVLYEEVL